MKKNSHGFYHHPQRMQSKGWINVRVYLFFSLCVWDARRFIYQGWIYAAEISFRDSPTPLWRPSRRSTKRRRRRGTMRESPTTPCRRRLIHPCRWLFETPASLRGSLWLRSSASPHVAARTLQKCYSRPLMSIMMFCFLLGGLFVTKLIVVHQGHSAFKIILMPFILARKMSAF